MAFHADDIMQHPSQVLNTPSAAHFPLSAIVVLQSLPQGNHQQQLAALHNTYSDPTLRAKVETMLESRKKKAPAKGTPFPTGVTLTDKDGQQVDIAQLQGKFVYIDVWASWCAPCCKEVPYLQQLEQDVDNPNVVFVSISVDKDEAAWKKKMDALNMHGNQWLNKDNSLADALNIKGIPHFVIYDKQGNLLSPNAPRPSQPETKELLEALH